FNAEDKKVTINRTDCVGCDVCKQVCPTGAILKESEAK
ncbi:MAG: 4Fe-4S binding protein, partial [Eubacterium sp.]|nr:4Fe-4S binding protein [Eubacterium sp.]